MTGPETHGLVEPRERAAFETELWVVPTGSGEPRRVLDRVPYGFEHARVSWTADNRHVVLGGAIAGRGNMDLYVVDAARGSIHALTSGVTEAVSPSVSPDGNRIAFASGTNAADLMHINLDGSEIRSLLASARDEQDPSWSPNGAQVAYVTNARGTPEIWLRSIREGWSAPVVRGDSIGSADFQNLGRPVFSPDGQRLAYDVSVGTHGIWVSSIWGGQAVPLDNQSSDQHSPSWSPDGEWVAYQRLHDKQWELVKVSVSGGVPIDLQTQMLAVVRTWPGHPAESGSLRRLGSRCVSCPPTAREKGISGAAHLLSPSRGMGPCFTLYENPRPATGNSPRWSSRRVSSGAL